MPKRTFKDRTTIGTGGDRRLEIPAHYKGYATPRPMRLLQNVQVVCDELK